MLGYVSTIERNEYMKGPIAGKPSNLLFNRRGKISNIGRVNRNIKNFNSLGKHQLPRSRALKPTSLLGELVELHPRNKSSCAKLCFRCSRMAHLPRRPQHRHYFRPDQMPSTQDVHHLWKEKSKRVKETIISISSDPAAFISFSHYRRCEEQYKLC